MQGIALGLLWMLISVGALAEDCGPVPPGMTSEARCRLEPAPLPLSAFKGLELYSWKQAGKWRFALMSGKNAGQRYSQLEAAQVGLEELGKRMDQAGAGSSVAWNPQIIDGLALASPPAAILRKVFRECAARQLKCEKPTRRPRP